MREKEEMREEKYTHTRSREDVDSIMASLFCTRHARSTTNDLPARRPQHKMSSQTCNEMFENKDISHFIVQFEADQ